MSAITALIMVINFYAHGSGGECPVTRIRYTVGSRLQVFNTQLQKGLRSVASTVQSSEYPG